jgi:hypothetical protein
MAIYERERKNEQKNKKRFEVNENEWSLGGISHNNVQIQQTTGKQDVRGVTCVV